MWLRSASAACYPYENPLQRLPMAHQAQSTQRQMPMNSSYMAREIAEIPQILRHQAEAHLPTYLKAGQKIAALNPSAFVTCARGTSDQAALFFKYLMETRAGLPVASMGPSVASIYEADLRLQNMVCLTLSQSGGSPDLLALQNAAKKGGARTLAFLNETASPVGQGAEVVLPVAAGHEQAVAATKSYVATLFALTGFVAGFLGDQDLEAGLRQLPAAAASALKQDWLGAVAAVSGVHSLYTVGRGAGLAIAGEAALKFKETCRLHAEVFSGAEVLHGPIVLAERSFVAFCFVPEDQGKTSVLHAAQAMAAQQATVFRVTCSEVGPGCLAVPSGPHPLLLPILQIMSFYRFVEELSQSLGNDPDAPVGLKKVTATI